MEKIKHIQKTLTPIILEKGMSGYDTVQDIEEKLNDPEVFNIAITGPYGSGKSSVLKSLKTLFPNNHTYLTISLASLTGDRKNGDKLNNEEQQKVEYSILQQLIYKEKLETLPNSRFRRIEQRKKWNAWYGIAALTFIVAFLIVFEPQWSRVDTFYELFNLGYRWNLMFDLCFSLYMLCCVFAGASYLYRHPSIWRVKALKMKDVSIELGQDSSVFNKHLEEIVYFFESTRYDVVIIEDLDRFRCPEIFQKLREINFLLQQSEVLKEQKRHIKFIYAVKDDLFKDAERTKFFDYIATVIPVVNPKNSCEKLTQELTERGYTLDKETLQDLSEFIDDMRMLKNVANEFQQYMERLSKSSSPNKEKLLAMIIYKNHHPDDFGKLHYKDGKVYEFIRRKSEWLQMAIDKVTTPRLELWHKKREDVINSQRFTLKQWRIIYMEKYRQHLASTLVSLSAKGAYHSVNEFVNSPELFEELIGQRRVSYNFISQFGRNEKANADLIFSDLEKEVDDRVDYMTRKELAKTSTSDIDNEIRMVREEENRLKNYKLAKLLIQFPEIKKNEKFLAIGLTELMVHFLQREYIDETYYDYLTLYDGTTMSLNDRDLLSRIKQNDTNVTYDKEIDDIEAFVNELPLFVYEYKSVLNYQIADYLESHPVRYKSALQCFEHHFLDNSMPPLDFMAEYYKKKCSGAELLWKKFIKAQSSWQRIQTYEMQEYWDTLMEAWLKYCEPADITDEIREWLNRNLGFCIERLGTLGVKHMKEIIEECLFEDISSLGPIGGKFQGEDVMDVANFILENKLFELTENNIFVACEITSSPFSERRGTEFLTISDILASGNNGFKEYVIENIKEVFTNIINKSKGQETEAGLVFLLNQEELEEKQKIAYLKRQTKNKVLAITDINDPYKPLAIRGNVLKPTWVNLLNYFTYEQEMITEDLENFINDNVESLLKDEYPNDVESTLAGELVYGAYLHISSYEKLLPVLMHNVNEDDEIKISKDTGIEKVKLLVKNNYLSDKVGTAKVVAFYGVSLYAKYLSHHINSIISNYEDYDMGTKTLTVLLDKESSLTNGQRWNLAKKVSAYLILQDAELANVILVLMLKRKEELTWPVVEATIKKASIMPQKQQYQKWLIKRHRGSIEKVIAIIKTMVEPYSEIVDDSKRPLIPKDFKEYLDILEPLGLFTSFKEEDKGYRVYHSTK